mmetsp:Transcript_50878/g.121674  ORF Transcript_50878/g.121674 Transcript_50878/m.121674 type:complete len:213 (+) Transcript_50878:310-948(+)
MCCQRRRTLRSSYVLSGYASRRSCFPAPDNALLRLLGVIGAPPVSPRAAFQAAVKRSAPVPWRGVPRRASWMTRCSAMALFKVLVRSSSAALASCKSACSRDALDERSRCASCFHCRRSSKILARSCRSSFLLASSSAAACPEKLSHRSPSTLFPGEAASSHFFSLVFSHQSPGTGGISRTSSPISSKASMWDSSSSSLASSSAASLSGCIV